MVNRVLIRIKVVQILYSYLLTSSEFHILRAPDEEAASVDRRYAYTVYIRALSLMLRLSGYPVGDSSEASRALPKNQILHSSYLARTLAADEALREAIATGRYQIAMFDPILAKLYDEITSSKAYRSYTRQRHRDATADYELWKHIMVTYMEDSEAFIKCCRGAADEFSSRGLKMGIDMAVATLKEATDIPLSRHQAEADIDRSLEKAYELYHRLLELPIALTRLEEERLEDASMRPMSSGEEVAGRRFVENKFVEALMANRSRASYIEENPGATWDGEPLLLRRLLDMILRSDLYRDYIDGTAEPTMADDCEFWRAVMKSLILPSVDLAEVLEADSVFWNDDLEIMGSFVLKTIKQFATAGDGAEQIELLPRFKDEEDAQFGPSLLAFSADNRDAYRELIDSFINREQWDTERIAFMDIVVLIAAIAELLHFPSIPAAVTVNEYIEIANAYSTPKSGRFVNGILSSVIQRLNSEGKLLKTL